MSDSQPPVALPEHLNPQSTPMTVTDSAASAATAVPSTPQTPLTFLLVSGRRRTMSFDTDINIGRVKELVWNAWPSEWQDERPPAPSYLRILHLGKILQDDDVLSSLNLPEAPAPPTIVHLAIRQYAVNTDDDMAKKKKKLRSSSDVGDLDADAGRTGSCCGCIIC